MHTNTRRVTEMENDERTRCEFVQAETYDKDMKM